jgi:hypothetical protein
MMKQMVNCVHTCPFCHEKVSLGIERMFLATAAQEEHSLYTHIHLHGNPLHALVCYIDKQFTVRGIEVVKSIDIEQNSETFQQFLKKWVNR